MSSLRALPFSYCALSTTTFIFVSTLSSLLLIKLQVYTSDDKWHINTKLNIKRTMMTFYEASKTLQR
jgi:hypothetical protein